MISNLGGDNVDKDEEIKKLKEKIEELEEENTAMKYAIYISNEIAFKK